MAHCRFFSQQLHNFTPRSAVLAGAAMKQVGQNVCALVQESGVTVALAALFQQRHVENDAPFVRIGGASEGLGAAADLHPAIEHFAKRRPQRGGFFQPLGQTPIGRHLSDRTQRAGWPAPRACHRPHC